MRTITRITTIGLTLFGCVGCDQASKSVVRRDLCRAHVVATPGCVDLSGLLLFGSGHTVGVSAAQA